MPTDGVEDYCIFLGAGLSSLGIELERIRIPWIEKGWIGALRQLARECTAWRSRWVLMQYTAFTWSRRGFPFPALMALALLRRSGARVVIVFHEPCRQGGIRWIDRFRGACQDWVIRSLYRRSAKSIFTVPLETVSWLPKGENKAAFIPIGANIPERVNRRGAPGLEGQNKTVIVFGITGAPELAREAEQIAGVLREASKTLNGLRLVAVGRGTAEAREQLLEALDGCNVELLVRGIQPAEEVARELEQADVLLFVRSAITPQRGSAMAGVASGIPIVGYRDRKVIGPLEEAGIEWSPSRNRESLTHCLTRVLSDPQRWMELHERNLAAQKNHFSWRKIAERYHAVLTE
jgi:glycosyltransferase involved in cell wall biosynthesis